jgi:creatinine amidohydrolase
MKYWLHEMTWEEAQEAFKRTDVVLLPIGSTEQHGTHLPLGTDIFIPLGVVDEVASRTGAIIAPLIPYGVCPHHMVKPGTVTISSETLINLLVEVCESLHHWGAKNILIINGHNIAQNPEVEIAIQKFQMRVGARARAFLVDQYAIMCETFDQIRETPYPGGTYHAAEEETSYMLHFRPDLVHMDRAHDVRAKSPSRLIVMDGFVRGEWIGYKMTKEWWGQLTPYGNIGDATKGTREKGEKMARKFIDNLVEFIDDLKDWPLPVSD